MSLTVFWFRRDLRFHDNHGLYEALRNQKAPVQPIFIFDPDILDQLTNPEDSRVQFLHETVTQMKADLQKKKSDLWVFYGKPLDVFKKLLKNHSIHSLYFNHDYEPKCIQRDLEIEKLCRAQGIDVFTFKDHVIFEKNEVLTQQGKPYTVYTPYKKKWLSQLRAAEDLRSFPSEKEIASCNRPSSKFKPTPTLKEMGFSSTHSFHFAPARISKKILQEYEAKRNFPGEDGTTHVGLHLRFGTVSVREMARWGREHSLTWLSELIWREFFIQILFHFPFVEKSSFCPDYEKIAWRKSAGDFKKWQEGRTGYPLVDAGMRQLKETGFMPNRVRMVAASFLTKHLLIHWQQGEKHFASYLLDYELAVNNGNWQWCAGTGCDAAPFFRIFNPETQHEKFDPQNEYIRKWIPEWGSAKYPEPMIPHSEARERALRAFYTGLKSPSKGGKK